MSERDQFEEKPGKGRDSLGGNVLDKLQDAFSTEGFPQQDRGDTTFPDQQQQQNHHKRHHRLENLLEKYVTEGSKGKRNSSILQYLIE